MLCQQKLSAVLAVCLVIVSVLAEVEAAAAVAAVTSSAAVVEPPKEDAVTSETKGSMDKAVGREKLDSKSKCTCSRISRINYLRKIDQVKVCLNIKT